MLLLWETEKKVVIMAIVAKYGNSEACSNSDRVFSFYLRTNNVGKSKNGYLLSSTADIYSNSVSGSLAVVVAAKRKVILNLNLA